MSIPALSPKRPCLLYDVEKALEITDHRAETSAKECETKIKATLADEVRWFLADASSASAKVLLPTPTSIDKAILVDHINQKGQKEDDVKVLTHLWRFFL